MRVRPWGDHDYGTAVREDILPREVAEAMNTVLRGEKGVEFVIIGEEQNDQVRFSYHGRNMTRMEILWVNGILKIENPDEWVVRSRRVS